MHFTISYELARGRSAEMRYRAQHVVLARAARRAQRQQPRHLAALARGHRRADAPARVRAGEPILTLRN